MLLQGKGAVFILLILLSKGELSEGIEREGYNSLGFVFLVEIAGK